MVVGLDGMHLHSKSVPGLANVSRCSVLHHKSARSSKLSLGDTQSSHPRWVDQSVKILPF